MMGEVELAYGLGQVGFGKGQESALGALFGQCIENGNREIEDNDRQSGERGCFFRIEDGRNQLIHEVEYNARLEKV
jgi:hypothetical protein